MKRSFSRYYTITNVYITKYFRWFVIFEIISILLIAWFVLLQNAYTTIREQGLVGYAQIQSDIEMKKQRLQSLERMSSALREVDTERLRQLSAVLPVGLNPTQLIADMNTFAKSAQVTIESIDVVQQDGERALPTESASVDEEATPGTAQPSDAGFTGTLPAGVRTATITMSVHTPDGTYETLKTFLDALESFVPVLDLQSLNYAPETTSYALQVDTYYIETAE